jgi:uncharacterized membrane protein YfcA
MLTGGIPRGALWLAGGILATILGAVVNQIFHDRVVAVIASVVFAVAFGAAVERMVATLKRRTSTAASPPSAQDPVDKVRAGDHTS